jgi:hypothetical protein
VYHRVQPSERSVFLFTSSEVAVGRIIDKLDVNSVDPSQAARWLLLADTALRLWEKQADAKRDSVEPQPEDHLPMGKVS